MNIILKRLALFAIIGFILLNGLIAIFPFAQNRVVASESVIQTIIRSKTQASGKILLIGDSVAKQLKLEYSNSDFWDLTTNQAISLAGQYVLVKNALVNNPDLEKVILIYHPLSFNNNLDQKWTFNYFCKPFLYIDNYNTWSNSVVHQISQQPYWLVYFPLVRYGSLLGFIDYSDGSRPQSAFLSDISFHYLLRIQQLSEEFGLEFIIVAPTLSRASVKNVIELRNSIQMRGLEDPFRNYNESITYLPDSCFIDSIHIKSKHLDYASLIVLNNIEQIP